MCITFLTKNALAVSNQERKVLKRQNFPNSSFFCLKGRKQKVKLKLSYLFKTLFKREIHKFKINRNGELKKSLFSSSQQIRIEKLLK